MEIPSTQQSTSVDICWTIYQCKLVLEIGTIEKKTWSIGLFDVDVESADRDVMHDSHTLHIQSFVVKLQIFIVHAIIY